MPSKLKTYLIIVLAATSLVSGLIAWNQSKRLAALQSELLKTDTPVVAKPRSASDPMPILPAVTETQTAAPRIEATTTEAFIEETAASQRPRSGTTRPNFAALMANPEFAQAMNLQQRAALDARYAALFKKLNLTPAELDKLKNLLVERQSARMDVMAASRENGLNPRENRDELNKLVAEAQAEVDANIKGTLGEPIFNQYQNFEATQPQRNLVSQLDQRLSYSSSPLNGTQADFLVNALAASKAPNADTGGGPGNWGGGASRTTITDAVIQQAQSVLTPDQVSALQQLQAEQKAQQQIREIMRAPASGTNAPSR